MDKGSVIIYDNGDMEIVQGDSFPFLIEGIKTDKDYEVYFSIYNSKGKRIGDEVHVNSGYADSVVLEIPSTLTDLLTVKGGIESTEDYYYGIKLCHAESGLEETQKINGKEVGELSVITVHPKKVEGI